jgi:hypothetical protein
MKSENVILRKSEMEKIIESCSKTILSRFSSLNFSNPSEKILKKKNHNKRKKTKQVNLSIVERRSSTNIAHPNTGIDDLYVYEYEISPFTKSKCERMI